MLDSTTDIFNEDQFSEILHYVHFDEKRKEIKKVYLKFFQIIIKGQFGKSNF